MFAYSIVLQGLLLTEAPLMNSPFSASLHYIEMVCSLDSADILTSLCLQSVWDSKLWKNLGANVYQSVSSITVLIQTADNNSNNNHNNNKKETNPQNPLY